jgi:hypothetical protein
MMKNSTKPKGKAADRAENEAEYEVATMNAILKDLFGY